MYIVGTDGAVIRKPRKCCCCLGVCVYLGVQL